MYTIEILKHRRVNQNFFYFYRVFKNNYLMLLKDFPNHRLASRSWLTFDGNFEANDPLNQTKNRKKF